MQGLETLHTIGGVGNLETKVGQRPSDGLANDHRVINYQSSFGVGGRIGTRPFDRDEALFPYSRDSVVAILHRLGDCLVNLLGIVLV